MDWIGGRLCSLVFKPKEKKQRNMASSAGCTSLARSGQWKLHLAILHSAAAEDTLQRQTVCQAQGSLTPSLACSSLSYWTEVFLLLNPCSVKTHPEQRPYKLKHLCVILHMNTATVRKSGKTFGHTGKSSRKSKWQVESSLELAALGRPKSIFCIDFWKQRKLFEMGPKSQLNIGPRLLWLFWVDMNTWHRPSRVPWLYFRKHWSFSV